MNVNPNHPKSFFKYMSASTAEKVLKNRTLRWSHPIEFDDTLDVAQVCDGKMDRNKQKQIHDAIIDLAASSPANLNKRNTNKIFKCLSSLISLFGSGKSSAISELKKGSVDISNSIAEINERWKEIRNDFRILCLSIEKDNHHLWNKYAEEHKGVVIELACRDSSDSPWLIAKPVEYVNEKNLFITKEDWAEISILELKKAVEYLFEKCTLRKAKDNKHKWFEQNEWRIPSFCRHHETGTISDYGVNPNDFSAVYFGHKMDFETQDDLLSLLVGELGHVSAFRCELDSSQNISFRKLN
ncbi:MAG: hypothetical protein FVQ85_01915 [Planctomycetes bacterium]|nr:hypothetical protein [Planctomycetota bacterium]